MKQKLLKLMCLLCVGMISMSAWADVTANVDLSKGSYDTDHITWTLNDVVTITQTQGSSATAVNSSYISSPRFYAGHVVNFEATTGYVIKSIVISGPTGTGSNSISKFGSPSGWTINSTAGTATWSGNNNSVSIKSDAQVRPTGISITYASSSATPADGVKSIVLSGTYKTTFNQGETFTHEGIVVTAIMGDDSEQVVTSDAVFSDPDMSTSGNKTITVSYTDKYEVINTATYDITVNFAVTDGVFDFVNAGNNSEDYGSGVTLVSSGYETDDATWTAGNVTMVTSVTSGNGYRWWDADKTLRFYNESAATFTVPVGYVITKIVTTGANFNNASVGTLSGSTWTGLSREVKLSATATKNISSITVTYTNKYTRTVTSGNYGTICLPYSATVTGATLYSITGKDENSITIAETGSTTATAGVPYIFKATSDEFVATYTSGVYTAATSANGLVGNTESASVDVPVNGNCGVLSGGRIYILETGATATTGQYKAYIDLSQITGGGDVKGIRLYFDDAEATGIKNLTPALSEGEGVIYNLQGQRVNSLQRGINIIGGKKVLVK